MRWPRLVEVTVIVTLVPEANDPEDGLAVLTDPPCVDPPAAPAGGGLWCDPAMTATAMTPTAMTDAAVPASTA